MTCSGDIRGPQPDDAERQFALARALKDVGQYDDSLAAFGDVLDLRPDHAEAHCDRGLVLYELGRFDEAARAHRRAIDIRPDYAKAHCYLGRTLTALGRPGDALGAFGRALDIEPGYAKAHFFLGLAEKELGRLDEAIAAFRRAIAARPDYDKAWYNLAIALLARGDGRAALGVCDDFLETHPGHTRILGFKAVVLRELGEDGAAGRLVDFDRLVRKAHIGVPDGYADLAAFNAALAGHVRAHPSLVSEPTSRSTRHGLHTGELLVEPKGPIAALEAFIREQVRHAIETLPEDSTQPYLANRPRTWDLTAWSIVLDSQGHEITHIHPDGWMSGVYYVRLPDVIGTGGENHAGWIELGRPRDHYPCRRAHETRAYRPEEGMMLMFPSYVYHRTVPFESDQERISIAFDVMPRD